MRKDNRFLRRFFALSRVKFLQGNGRDAFIEELWTPEVNFCCYCISCLSCYYRTTKCYTVQRKIKDLQLFCSFDNPIAHGALLKPRFKQPLEMPKRRREQSQFRNTIWNVSFYALVPIATCAFQHGSVTYDFNPIVRSHEILMHRFSASDIIEAEIANNEVDIAGMELRRTQSYDNNSKFPQKPPWLRKKYGEDPIKEIQWLEIMLLEHGLSADDISAVVKAVYLCASGDSNMILGIIDFIKMIVEIGGKGSENLVSKDVVLAGVLHYTECVNARLDGVYEKVEHAFRLKGLPAEIDCASQTESPQKTNFDYEMDDIGVDMSENSVFSGRSTSLRQKLTKAQGSVPHGFDIFTKEAVRLAAEASQIKRAEILADVVLMQSRALTPDEYQRVRDLLVSVMDDWRGLAIRCVASLYRLEGVLEDIPQSGTGNSKKRNFAMTLAARNSIRVYANLAERIGLHRLKSQLEAGAFRILYPRQYSAVSTLFEQKGSQMKYISSFLTSQMKALLNEDYILKGQLDQLVISSRVKEPYSFWKKILKKRKEQRGHGRFLSPSDMISVIDVKDGVALRVILKAKKLSPQETSENIREREKMLCYYAHHLIRSHWPATDESRVKDYIKNPKENGYQSLHHTSSIIRNGQEFPFEIQVRSEEMHLVAEYGVAAHWDYKLGGQPAALLPPSKPYRNDGPNGCKSETSKYIDALENARHVLVRSSIFVFLFMSTSLSGEGKLLTLQKGAQIVELLSELGESETRSYNTLQAWRNGQPAQLTDIVNNGDVVVLSSGPPRNLPSLPMLPPVDESVVHPVVQ